MSGLLVIVGLVLASFAICIAGSWISLLLIIRHCLAPTRPVASCPSLTFEPLSKTDSPELAYARLLLSSVASRDHFSELATPEWRNGQVSRSLRKPVANDLVRKLQNESSDS